MALFLFQYYAYEIRVSSPSAADVTTDHQLLTSESVDDKYDERPVEKFIKPTSCRIPSAHVSPHKIDYASVAFLSLQIHSVKLRGINLCSAATAALKMSYH